VVDHRDEGEGIKLALMCGDAYEVAEHMPPGPLPRGCWLEVINGECLRLLKG